MVLRPFFAKVLAPSVLLVLFSLGGAATNGCGMGWESNLNCDENDQNCVCDDTGCRPAKPSVDLGSSSSGGNGGEGGGITSAPCDPQLATCGCKTHADCPAGLFCIDGLCIEGCNSSLECGADKVCVNGKCEIGCDDQTPCKSGYICDKGYCILNVASPECAGSGACADTQRICVNGICQTPCTTNADCSPGEVCDGTTGSCISDPNPVPSCGPNKPCSGSAQCGADGYCHFGCTTLNDCKLIDSRFFACDQGICKTEEEANPECSLGKPCPPGQDCVSNKCL